MLNGGHGSITHQCRQAHKTIRRRELAFAIASAEATMPRERHLSEKRHGYHRVTPPDMIADSGGSVPALMLL